MIKLLALADGITLLNAVLGFTAIIMLFSDEIRLFFSLILLALLADGLDGIVARKTKKGKIGEYLEAMADLISLSVAPMLFVYTIYAGSPGSYLFVLVIGLLIFFLICSLIRLSSFHLMKEKTVFVGLPASASTIFIIGLTFLGVELIYILAVIIILSLAMVSPIHFPKPGVRINSVAMILISVTVLLGKLYQGIAPILLMLALTVYVIGGPLYLQKRAGEKAGIK